MQEEIRISSDSGIFLQVLSFMYVLFTIFGTHGLYMWIIGHDLSLAWRIAWIDNGLPSLVISWMSMEIVGLFLSFFFCWFSCFLSLG